MACTRKELKKVADKMFKEIDTNGNGVLEKSEVRSFTEMTLKIIKPDQEFNEEDFEEQFKVLDAN